MYYGTVRTRHCQATTGRPHACGYVLLRQLRVLHSVKGPRPAPWQRAVPSYGSTAATAAASGPALRGGGACLRETNRNKRDGARLRERPSVRAYEKLKSLREAGLIMMPAVRAQSKQTNITRVEKERVFGASRQMEMRDAGRLACRAPSWLPLRVAPTYVTSNTSPRRGTSRPRRLRGAIALRGPILRGTPIRHLGGSILHAGSVVCVVERIRVCTSSAQ